MLSLKPNVAKKGMPLGSSATRIIRADEPHDAWR
jgi:hypothetical protein